ncbi:MAG: TetR/AcrR family transcriptional regulator, partial [Solirubrobacteraceae bacterium]
AGTDAGFLTMKDNPQCMEEERRPLRADAERNRRRLIDAATAIFCERGLEVGVGEIAERAGVGRGTLFRNFPCKEDLIAAVVVERMRESVERGQALLDAPDPGEALFGLIDQAVGRSQTDHALFDALDEAWLTNDEIRAAHAELLAVLDQLVCRAQAAGSVRPDVSAVDVLMMTKGVCEASRSFQHIDPNLAARQLDLVWSAIASPCAQHALRGQPPPVEALERPAPDARAASTDEPAPGEPRPEPETGPARAVTA